MSRERICVLDIWDFFLIVPSLVPSLFISRVPGTGDGKDGDKGKGE